jgi:hypothetical protein
MAGVNEMSASVVFTGLSASRRVSAKIPANDLEADQRRLRVDAVHATTTVRTSGRLCDLEQVEKP